ncbi:MAG: ATP-binding protein [Vicinamibacterales bacterium]
MKILVSWSSGKDSAWMLHLLRQAHPDAVQGLLTTTNDAFDRVAMHGVRREVLEAQARAAGLPLHVVPLPWPCANEDYDRLMGVAVAQALADGFTHVAFGDLFLEEVRRYREDRLAGSGLTPLFPLWRTGSTADLARAMLAGGLQARLSTVDPRVLDPRFAGRAFDAALLAELPPAVDPCGERGEFHTCVTGGPMFAHPFEVAVGPTVIRDGFAFADLTLAS